ncbi:MAG: 2-oxoglutarate dehydrogenase E1 component [Gemmatimonadetes bacterium]|nr:2-oxoglutarate dehydrogenase E1 component [Gemmatimonadota bacterium]
MDEPLFDSQNAAYAQAMFEQYARDPESVPQAWRRFFDDGGARALAEGLLLPEQLDGRRGAVAAPPPQVSAQQTVAPPPRRDASPARTVAPATETVAPAPAPEAEAADASVLPGLESAARSHSAAAEALRRALPVVSRAAALVQAFRDHGHRLARIDPLGSEPPGHPHLSPAFLGSSLDELAGIHSSAILEDGKDRSVAEALEELRDLYAGSIAYEFEHVDDHEKVGWLWDQVETGAHFAAMTPERRRDLLRRITRVEGLEQFLQRAYLGQKRFSIEGIDMLVPMLDLALQEIIRAGGREAVLGMAHRGRLNVLAHNVGVSYGELLSEFEGPGFKGGKLEVHGTGDVKYHHGAKGVQTFDGLGDIAVTLMPNPSHLEFVNPVVVGFGRARQFESAGKDASPNPHAVVPILMHGDAAFAAEGVVAETLNMARLLGYDVGGTLHIIENNQIGFTTDPGDGRSTLYASDLAKGYGIPVVHVNADDPEACLAAVRLGMAYRTRFCDDFVIDLVGYRRHGHNEGDEPSYTQPLLYRAIAAHPTVRAIYADRLQAEGVLGPEDAQAMVDEMSTALHEAQDRARDYHPVGDDELDPEYERPVVPETTGVPLDVLTAVNEALVRLPDGFSPHPKLWRQLQRRSQDFGPEHAIDWAHAESLALGSLLMEGIPVRLSGQDTRRGTFSQRHLVLHDVETGATTVPLQGVSDTRLEVYDSPLTETGVVGFEYGYSVGADADVVLWEAQFGDFVNVAQVMLDQFLAAGLTKWGQYSRLTLLLPHGFEGQGPEHSSARLERFLQLCAEGNIRVTYPTTPAQYFHLLRRQALRRPERPMVVMTPKSLLRHPMATSTVEELTRGGFEHVLDDPGVADPAAVRRLVVCSGKVYYDVQGHARRGEAAGTAIARMELLYPFPTEALGTLLARYPSVSQVIWLQEEPRNMGGLTFVGPRLRGVVPRKVVLTYVARPERASPAEGKAKDHLAQQEKLVLEALGLEEAEK